MDGILNVHMSACGTHCDTVTTSAFVTHSTANSVVTRTVPLGSEVRSSVMDIFGALCLLSDRRLVLLDPRGALTHTSCLTVCGGTVSLVKAASFAFLQDCCGLWFIYVDDDHQQLQSHAIAFDTLVPDSRLAAVLDLPQGKFVVTSSSSYQLYRGKVDVYHYRDDSLIHIADLVAVSPYGGQGYSVAAANTTGAIVVGAPYSDRGAGNLEAWRLVKVGVVNEAETEVQVCRVRHHSTHTDYVQRYGFGKCVAIDAQGDFLLVTDDRCLFVYCYHRLHTEWRACGTPVPHNLHTSPTTASIVSIEPGKLCIAVVLDGIHRIFTVTITLSIKPNQAESSQAESSLIK
jgi:hypothetical protein